MDQRCFEQMSWILCRGKSSRPLTGEVHFAIVTSSPNVIRVIKSRRMTCRISVGNPEEETPLGRPRRECERNVEVGLLELDWIRPTQFAGL